MDISKTYTTVPYVKRAPKSKLTIAYDSFCSEYALNMLEPWERYMVIGLLAAIMWHTMKQVYMFFEASMVSS
jgi:hypothetical protein